MKKRMVVDMSDKALKTAAKRYEKKHGKPNVVLRAEIYRRTTGG